MLPRDSFAIVLKKSENVKNIFPFSYKKLLSAGYRLYPGKQQAAFIKRKLLNCIAVCL